MCSWISAWLTWMGIEQGFANYVLLSPISSSSAVRNLFDTIDLNVDGTLSNQRHQKIETYDLKFKIKIKSTIF